MAGFGRNIGPTWAFARAQVALGEEGRVDARIGEALALTPEGAPLRGDVEAMLGARP